MFIRFVTLLFVATMAAFVAATPSALEARDGSSQCNTGSISCCQFTQQANPTTINQISSALGIALPNVAGLVGLGCAPLTVLGVGSGSTCTAQVVCCSNNFFGGVVNLGCTPINLSL